MHKELGPGLLESAYQMCLVHELMARGLRTSLQVPVQVVYKGAKVDCGYRLDILVEDAVIVEVKSVERLLLKSFIARGNELTQEGEAGEL